jgi:hypothetical protein
MVLNLYFKGEKRMKIYKLSDKQFACDDVLGGYGTFTRENVEHVAENFILCDPQEIHAAIKDMDEKCTNVAFFGVNDKFLFSKDKDEGAA